MLPTTESLTVEFKSDRPKPLPDHDLIDAVVGMANAEGGDVYLGVEDDGVVTGVSPQHSDAVGAAALIANCTTPRLSVNVTLIKVNDVPVLHCQVPKAKDIVCTNRGRYLQRRLRDDHEPECVPLFPHELVSRRSDLGVADLSAQVVTTATPEDLDPVERQRLRNTIQNHRGDQALLRLSDAELDEVLGLVQRVDGIARPTVCGLLLIGRESALRQHIPGHEVAFQVLSGTAVQVNEFSRAPLLQIFERVMILFAAQVREQEIDFLGQRIGVPNYDREGFREALVNALIHRDWSRLGAIHIQFHTDELRLSNPGGFVEGVSQHNILVTPPRPRNPLLADVVKRLGLAERTGRGVDRIVESCVRYGRLPPSYASSNRALVELRIPGGQADLDLLRCLITYERSTGTNLPVEALVVLSTLRRKQHQRVEDLVDPLQRDANEVRAVFDRLVQAGVIAAHGRTSGRTYTLSPSVFQQVGDPAGFIHQAGFTDIQQEQMVLRYAREHGSIARAQTMELCRITKDQASRLLRKLRDSKQLIKKGERKGSYYEPGTGA